MDVALFTRIGLLLVRPGMLILSAPVFGGTFAPATVKVGLTGLLALAMLPAITTPVVTTPAGWTVLMAREAVIGLCLGFCIRLLTSAAELAGHMAGTQLGLSYAGVVDPMAGARNTLISSIYNLMAMMVFFAIDGHHHLIRALASSYHALPIGGGAIGHSLPTLVSSMLGVIFSVGLQLAAPIVIVLLTLEVGLGLMGRAAPMLNLMAQGFAVRVVVGLLVLSSAIGVVPDVITRLTGQMLELAARLALAFK